MWSLPAATTTYWTPRFRRQLVCGEKCVNFTAIFFLRETAGRPPEGEIARARFGTRISPLKPGPAGPRDRQKSIAASPDGAGFHVSDADGRERFPPPARRITVGMIRKEFRAPRPRGDGPQPARRRAAGFTAKPWRGRRVPRVSGGARTERWVWGAPGPRRGRGRRR